MTISKHINSLQQHLAQLGLYQVPTEVYELQWQQLRDEQHNNTEATGGQAIGGGSKHTSKDLN